MPIKRTISLILTLTMFCIFPILAASDVLDVPEYEGEITRDVITHDDCCSTKFDYNHPDRNDEDMYLYGQIANAHTEGQTGLYSRASAQDPTKKEIRLPDGTILPEEQWLANFENVPVNAGYTVEVTLDSGTGYAEFLETVWDRPSARRIYDHIAENYEKTNTPINNPLNMPMRVPQNLQEILDAGELDEWYSYPTAPMIARPLRIAS